MIVLAFSSVRFIGFPSLSFYSLLFDNVIGMLHACLLYDHMEASFPLCLMYVLGDIIAFPLFQDNAFCTQDNNCTLLFLRVPTG